MKKQIIVILLLFLSYSSIAQVINLSQFQSTQNVTLKLRTVDKENREALGYVTVYLIPQNDTTITHFAISSEKGDVVIEDILPGRYNVNAEIIGYKPFSKEYTLSGWEKNLGEIALEEDTQFIDAATITAVGNPVTIKQDTIEFNASAYHVGSNAVLKDLLKKMPGMEVDDDGTVKVNGEKVDKITVGGKTFFFNDPSMAVKNLPAKIVDKIKVIDKDKSEAGFTGVGTKNDREKVMDVELKEEYKKGWFGNSSLALGTAPVSKEQKEEIGLKDPLYNASALVSGYNEQDQLTIIGNAYNVDIPGSGSFVVVDYSEGDELTSRDGIKTSSQLGANFNTSRIKGYETNSSVNYTYSHKDAREKSLTTSYMGDEADLSTDARFAGLGTDHNVKANFEIKKTDKSKFLFNARPSLNYTYSKRDLSSTSSTSAENEKKNSSESYSSGSTNSFVPNLDLTLGIKDLGKTGRALTFSSYLSSNLKQGDKTQHTRTVTGLSDESVDLLYKIKDNSFYAMNDVSYVEPISELIKIKVTVNADFSFTNQDKDAFNADGTKNTYYTSLSSQNKTEFYEELLLQYNKDSFRAHVGATVYQTQNDIHTQATGQAYDSGKGDWILNWAPNVQLYWKGDYQSTSINVGGMSNSPFTSAIAPALNLSDPVRISVGNSYLRQEFQQYSFINYSKNDPKRYSFFTLFLQNFLTLNSIVYANWFDSDGIRYAIPVNSTKPKESLVAYMHYSTPFGKDKQFKFAANLSSNITALTSYQASTTLPAIDTQNFDYDALMNWFWGEGPSGERFYSGESGFRESHTNTYANSVNASLSYNTDLWSIGLSGAASNSISKYSLDPSADMNTWDFSTGADLTYTHPKGWEASTDVSYDFYRGYSAGYGDPEFLWNASLSKQFGAFSLSMRACDILNQKKFLSRSASAEYVKDVYSNTIGRFFLIGITYNFGKMNAANNAKAQEAMWNMNF